MLAPELDDEVVTPLLELLLELDDEMITPELELLELDEELLELDDDELELLELVLELLELELELLLANQDFINLAVSVEQAPPHLGASLMLIGGISSAM